MNRRTFLFGLTSATGAGTMILGTGAFSSATLDRGISVDVVSDDQGYLSLRPGKAGGIVRIDSDGTFTIDPYTADGDGLNPNSTYGFGRWDESSKEVTEPVFQIINQGTEKQDMNVAYAWDSDEIGDSTMTWFFTGPSGNTQFTVDKNKSETSVTFPSFAVGEAVDVAFQVESADLGDDLSGDLTISSVVSE